MSVLKKIGLVIGGLIAAYIAIVVFFSLIFWTNGYLRAKQLRQQVVNVEQWLAEQQKAQEKMYREDTYGGKTPEETWAMFISALEKEDVELASRYFVVSKQKEYLEELTNLKKQEVIKSWIIELKKLRKSQNQSPSKEEVYYSYDYFSKEYNHILTGRVIFTFNPFTNIWKISIL